MGAPWEKYKDSKPWEKYGTGEPGAIDATEKPQSLGGKALDLGVGTLKTVGKVADAQRGLTTGPMVGSLIELLSGKKVYDQSDVTNAANPTNLKTFPSTSEMMGRAGVPEGAKLSDYVPGYSKPNPKNPWYLPEEGGMLDPSVRGTIGTGIDIAIDPLTYETLGGSVAEKALAKKLGEETVKKANVAMTPVSHGLKQLGRGMYSSVIGAVEHEGAKYGKLNVGDTLYNAGVKTPFGLRSKAENIGKELLEKRNAIYDEAADAGGRFNMSTFLQEPLQEVRRLRARNTPESLAAADALESQIAKYQEIAKPPVLRKEIPKGPDIPAIEPYYGAPYEPAVYGEAPVLRKEIPRGADIPKMEAEFVNDSAGKLSGYGTYQTPEKPNIRQVAPEIPAQPGNPWSPAVYGDAPVIKPGTPRGYGTPVPGIPAQPGVPWSPAVYGDAPGFSPKYGANVTTDIDKGIGPTAWNELLRTSEGAQMKKMLRSSAREETLRSVEKALGPEAAAKVAELNADYGKLASTSRAQERVANNADKLAGKIVNPSGHDVLTAALGGGSSMAVKMGLDALRLGVMPAGYGVRKLGESKYAGPLLDILLRQQYKESLNESGVPNGQEK